MMKSTRPFFGTQSSASVGLLAGVLSMGVLAACGSNSNDADDAKDDRPPAVGTMPETGGSDSTPAAAPIGVLAAKTKGLGSLSQLIALCGLEDAVNAPKASLTVFAPTDDAFKAFLAGAPFPSKCDAGLKGILTYHVLGARVMSGDLQAKQAVGTLAGEREQLFVMKDAKGVIVNGVAKVAKADVSASNGVVHVIDKVLLPDAAGTVVDAAVKRYDFSTLVSKVSEAGLVDALANTKDVTVFAPTDAAFAKLAAVPMGEALAKVLTHHVVPARILAASLVPGEQSAPTLEGSALAITVDADGARIRGSGETASEAGRIVATDIVTRNGVIHVVDEVLIPAGL